jgi:hypothetical protein
LSDFFLTVTATDTGCGGNGAVSSRNVVGVSVIIVAVTAADCITNAVSVASTVAATVISALPRKSDERD